jgi:hypothetical protein
MKERPQVGDILKLCKDADLSGYKYYEVDGLTVARYSRFIDALQCGAKLIMLKCVPAIGLHGAQLRALKGADYMLHVRIILDDGCFIKLRNDEKMGVFCIPSWMVSEVTTTCCMERPPLPLTERIM